MLIASDIHFGKEDVEGVNTLLQLLQNDEDRLLILPGDLTQLASEEAYELAKNFIAQVLNLGVRIIVTPGNHDFGGSWMGERLKVNSTARNSMKELLKPIFDQQEVVASEPTEGFDSIVRIDQHVFVVLRSTHKGKLSKLGSLPGPRIRKKQIAWARQSLQSYLDSEGLNFDKNDNKTVKLHFVTHHSLWQDEDDKHGSMDRRRRLESDLLSSFQFSTFFHGHNHRYVCASTTTPKTTYRIWRIGAPTLSTRNSHFERGFLTWKLSDVGTNNVPVLYNL